MEREKMRVSAAAEAKEQAGSEAETMKARLEAHKASAALERRAEQQQRAALEKRAGGAEAEVRRLRDAMKRAHTESTEAARGAALVHGAAMAAAETARSRITSALEPKQAAAIELMQLLRRLRESDEGLPPGSQSIGPREGEGVGDGDETEDGKQHHDGGDGSDMGVLKGPADDVGVEGGDTASISHEARGEAVRTGVMQVASAVAVHIRRLPLEQMLSVA